jgi:spore maturation protein CgeB
MPYDEIADVGRREYNRRLVERVKKEKPDIFFAVMYTDELMEEALLEIKKYTKSVAWMCDDHWRFDDYARRYPPYFSHVVTTYSKAVEQYKALGFANVIHSQWAADTGTYRPVTGPKTIGVSFFGSWNKDRGRIVRFLRESGIAVTAGGGGWPEGRIGQEDMVRSIAQSKINLGLNPPSSYFGVKPLIRLFFRRSGKWIIPDFWHFFGNVRQWRQKRIPQIKARMFEIPACGTLMMTQYADNLSDYYEIGKEIVIYEDDADLLGKIRYYLAHDAEREVIARAGYERTVRDHTYAERFKKIFTIALNA